LRARHAAPPGPLISLDAYQPRDIVQEEKKIAFEILAHHALYDKQRYEYCEASILAKNAGPGRETGLAEIG